ncbi:MAG: hypothetical protein SF123_07165 [Chloroflexota bacterium]|nr:hypothetical protein [Chloroflexota bacterium]
MADALIAALTDLPPGDPERIACAEALFADGLERNDPQSALAVAEAWDEDAGVGEALRARFEDALHTQPDAVYRLVRVRLASGADDAWRVRLHQAALAALHVAITDGDADTVTNWLTLIAREPAVYGLGEILHHGILSAQSRAAEDPKLAKALVLLALKRSPDALDTLLTNPVIANGMPADLRGILRDGTGDAILLLGSYSSDAFMAGVGRATERQWGALLTPPVVDQLWHFYSGGAGATLPARYQPGHVIDAWASGGAAWMSAAAFDRALLLALRDGRDDLAQKLAAQIADSAEADRRMQAALRQSERSPADVATLVCRWASNGIIAQNDAEAVLETAAAELNWSVDAAPLVHQWGLFAQKQPNAQTPDETLWQVLAFAAEQEDELVARATARQLYARLERTDDDALLIDGLATLIEQVKWSDEASAQVMTWWRDFSIQQQPARLTRLDRALEGRRELDDARAVTTTILAFRKMIGKRTLKQFADDIHLAFSTLEALMSAFDGDGKRAGAFDPVTMRAELDLHEDALTEQERHILATDFKELAHVIGVMGDHRSKPNLIRREEEVDRQLMQGDQEPHGAVDMLKWMAGYIDGLQAGDEDEGD